MRKAALAILLRDSFQPLGLLLPVVWLALLFGAVPEPLPPNSRPPPHPRRGRRPSPTSLRAVLDAIDNGILTLDRDLAVELINRRISEWFQVTPEQVVGRLLDEVIRDHLAPKIADPSKITAIVQWLHSHPETKVSEEFVQVVPERRIFRYFGGPVYEGHTFVGRIVTLSDITAIRQEQVEREAIGRVSQALVRELSLEGAAQVITEQAHQVLGANLVTLFIVDRSRQILRLVAQQGGAPELAAQIQAIPLDSPSLVAQAVQTGAPSEITDWNAQGASEQQPDQWAAIAGVRSEVVQPLFVHGQVVGVLGIAWSSPRQFSARTRETIRAFADLSAVAIERAQLFEEISRRAREAEEARQGLQRFTSMVAHDLRGPLTVLTGYVDLLGRREHRTASERQAIRAIENATRAMRRLVDDLLDAARIGAGRFEIRPAPTDLVSVIREVVTQQQAMTQRHRILVEMPDQLPGTWDREYLARVFSNLIANAIKYSPDGGEILVRLQVSNGEVIGSVTDHGIGIAPEQIPRLFQPFSRLETGPGATGVGLGLYISKAIVEAHHGRIWVTSEPGKGSTFYVALPRQWPGQPSRPTN